jgi:poly-gamma-glutamate capsule biosynthesis protein CapA/YwtB (metallophosphatase superfamily)
MTLRRLAATGALAAALLLLASCSALQGSSSMILGGDVMLARGGTALFSVSDPWQAIAPYLAEETGALFAVNLESPLGEIPMSLDPMDAEMNLCANPREVDLLIEGGVDLVTTANNHTGDCGLSEPEALTQLLQPLGITGVAAGEVMIERVGRQRVGFLAYDGYSGDGNLDALVNGIKIAMANSDLVVVSVHWGNEYQAGPTREQEEFAQTLVDAGVDLVWGHHPHVLQRMEWRASSVDEHQALVVYSLGNLLADQWMLPDTLRTALVRIEFEPHEIKRVEVLPLRMDTVTQVLQPALDDETTALITDRLGLNDLERQGVRVGVWGE